MVRQKSQMGMAEGDPKVYIQNCAPKQRTPVAGDAILPSPRGSLPEDSLCHKDDDNTVAKAPAMSSSAQPYVSSLRPNLTNYEIKCALMTEIRRFGRRKCSEWLVTEEKQMSPVL